MHGEVRAESDPGYSHIRSPTSFTWGTLRTTGAPNRSPAAQERQGRWEGGNSSSIRCPLTLVITMSSCCPPKPYWNSHMGLYGALREVQTQRTGCT